MTLMLAVLCADAHPLTPDVLSRRLNGHLGPHCADGSDPWPDTEENTSRG